MTRYCGDPVRPGGRIAVVSNDALGNFVAVTPLLQMLRREVSPACVDYFGGHRVQEMAGASDLPTRAYPLHGTPLRDALSWLPSDPYDLVINVEWTAWPKAFAGLLAGESTPVCGPSVGEGGRGDLPFADDLRGALWQDQGWIAESLPVRYPFLRSGFIGEIFARLAYLEGAVPRYRLPQAEPDGNVPDVLIATAASLPEKLWPIAKWVAVLERCRAEGWSVGLLGAKPSAQGRFWMGAAEEETLVERGLVHDLRGRFTLPQVVGASARARRVLSLDNGILHFAVAAGTPTVGLFRHGIHRLWAPPFDGLTVLTPGEGGQVADIEVDQVWNSLRDAR
ncbi:MAG: hypothetical protein KIS66_00715 [Fimbriimonadaceae bacterium]|nr:hypothetical protein [Fimbriimonadaceae bacterium]